MLMILTSVPGDMFSLELGSDFRYVTGALLLISVIDAPPSLTPDEGI